MWNFENNAVNGVPEYAYSRFVASWANVCRRSNEPVFYDEEFKEWLRKLGLKEDDVINITYMANCGKLELETSARVFLKSKKQ